MKTTIKLFALCMTCLFFTHTNAQTYVGLNLGLRGSSVSAITDEVNAEFLVPIVSFTVGAKLEHHLSRRFIVQTGIDLSARGFGIEIMENEAEYFYEERFGYVDVPLALKFHAGSDKFGLNLMAGTTLGFALGGQSNSYVALSTEEDKVREEVSESIDFAASEYSKFNAAILLGTGLYAKIGNARIFMDVAMEGGLTPLVAGQGDSHFVGTSFNTGVVFALGGKGEK
ncbi:MAG: outer membrane beta-barrel protein [Bacteroidota bacterium]